MDFKPADSPAPQPDTPPEVSGPSGPLTEDEVKALRMELDVTNETTQNFIRRTFQENAPAAAVSLCKLAIHSSDQRIRLQASQYVVERILGRIQDDPPAPAENPYEKLMKEVTVYLEDQVAIKGAEERDS